jgi:hypothetical protein
MKAIYGRLFRQYFQVNGIKSPKRSTKRPLKVHKNAVSRQCSALNVDENKAIAPVSAAEWQGTLRFAPSAAQKRRFDGDNSHRFRAERPTNAA